MALTAEDVARVAHLARIEITPEETVELRLQLERIFELIGEMRAVDTSGIVPMSHAQDLMLPLRDDVATESDHRVAFQALAPAVESGLYLVPKVID